MIRSSTVDLVPDDCNIPYGIMSLEKLLLESSHRNKGLNPGMSQWVVMVWESRRLEGLYIAIILITHNNFCGKLLADPYTFYLFKGLILCNAKFPQIYRYKKNLGKRLSII